MRFFFFKKKNFFSYNKAIQLNPNNYKAFNNKGLLLKL